jgi:hypothetical protein
VTATKTGGLADATPAGDNLGYPIVAAGYTFSIASNEIPVYALVAEEGATQQARPPVVLPGEVDASTHRAEGACESAPVREQEESPSSPFRVVLLGKLLLVSTAALAWYYLPVGRVGNNKSTPAQPAPSPR